MHFWPDDPLDPGGIGSCNLTEHQKIPTSRPSGYVSSLEREDLGEVPWWEYGDFTEPPADEGQAAFAMAMYHEAVGGYAHDGLDITDIAQVRTVVRVNGSTDWCKRYAPIGSTKLPKNWTTSHTLWEIAGAEIAYFLIEHLDEKFNPLALQEYIDAMYYDDWYELGEYIYVIQFKDRSLAMFEYATAEKDQVLVTIDYQWAFAQDNGMRHVDTREDGPGAIIIDWTGENLTERPRSQES
jgi:hypothetical protein